MNKLDEGKNPETVLLTEKRITAFVYESAHNRWTHCDNHKSLDLEPTYSMWFMYFAACAGAI